MTPPELSRLVPDAPQALLEILDGALGPVQPPIRSEIFGLQRFAQHGRSLGETHRAERAGSRRPTFVPRLRNNIKTLRQAHRYIGIQARTGYDISPAAEWLLDNFHLIEAQLKEIHDGLPRSYYRTLPILQDEPLAGLPRIYGVAWAFVAHTDGAFDEQLLTQYLDAYQETRALNLAEMWALPTTLRVVLVENLRRLAERVATNKAAREVANLVYDHIANYTVAKLDELLARMNQRGVGRTFLAQMTQRMQDLSNSAASAEEMAAYREWLKAALPDLAGAQAQQAADQAADNLSVSNAVTSLRRIGDADWPEIVEHTSPLMRVMLTSPVFAAEHPATRDKTLHGIELLARRCHREEVEVARTLLGLMQSATATAQDGEAWAVASYWLDGPGRPALTEALDIDDRAIAMWRGVARRMALPVYLGSLLLLTGTLVAWMLAHHLAGQPAEQTSMVAAWVVGLLMLFPASEAVVAVINRLISESARPSHLPRLSLAGGIPSDMRVLVVIPGMLTSADASRELVHRLRLHYLANPEQHAQFALLTDWADADAARAGNDDTLLSATRHRIDELNRLHPAAAGEAPRFIVLHRERVFSETEQRWIGWERKRGKLEQLIATIADSARHPSPFIDLGEASRIAPGARYIVTLDSDTHLPPGRLRELVGVAGHPHNQPRLAEDGKSVVSGYGILQPRVVTPLPAPRSFTLYHWLFAGQCGIDPYSAASSEVYQDVFGEGSFSGKGLIDVRAMYAVLNHRLPEGRVLSHDLLEGSMVRCAAVTDITVIEDAPFHADVAASRVHRWTRGDWQLLPFLLNAGRYRLRAINRWKMFDNLRRSLVAPMSLVLLAVALAGDAISPWAALLLVFAAFAGGPLLGALAGLAPHRDDLALRHFYQQALADLSRALWCGLWNIAQLMQQALLAADAITRALYRMLVSRRHLLQWTTAATAQAQATTDIVALIVRHWRTSAAAVVLLFALLYESPPAPVLTLVLCLAWAASPVWTWLVSRHRPPNKDAALPAKDQLFLEGIARDTWRLFERCVGPEDNHLPPDNLQTVPHDMVAHRTSPTNIGLYLLTTCCARSFGWIGTMDLLTRLEATLATLLTLERHRGHFLNWYDTQSRAPLMPQYVSTVDSGNLSGHLLAVAQACLELARAPFDESAAQRAIRHARERVTQRLPARASGVPAQQRDELRWRLADHRSTVRSARRDRAVDTAGGAAHASVVRRLHALATAFEKIAWEADYSFLYHRKRHLFHIGYRVAEQQRDAGFYDLLASESRLTSLLAIAKGDVPVSHWASLGRPFYAVGARAGLRSWSGSMFEYLMPTLVLDEPHGSVLHDAGNAAVREQIDFARTQNVPWGISESAYAASDHTLAYQYAPQGVPRLALRRTPADELVIAPYATALASQVAPHLAALNFTALEGTDSRARYGFIEALDYSPGRQSGTAPFTPVITFMAHHQGMSIVALANVLLDGPAQRWGMANAYIESVASLLHERAPREVSMLYAPSSAPTQLSMHKRAPGLLREIEPGTASVEPTHMLSNGRYNVALRPNGAGSSRFGATNITRSRDDALRDAFGSFFYLRWPAGTKSGVRTLSTAPVSITQHPAPDPAATYHATYHADRVCFDAAWPTLQAHTTVWVSPEDDIEFRQVELRNLSDRPLEIELLSAFEITLADPRADEAHPAFTSMFVRAEWQPEHQALMFQRMPRLPTEQALRAAHFLADADPQIVAVRQQTDRARWYGRNRATAQPLASFDPLPVSSEHATLDTGLDPVCALAVKVRIAPHGKARLTFGTAASDNAGTLRAVIDKYRQHTHVQRASLMSATLTGIRLRELGVGSETFAAIQTLSTALVMSMSKPGQALPGFDDNKAPACDRRLLWRFGISGDKPIVLVSAGVSQGLGLLRSLAQALRMWAWGGVACDLVVVNAEPSSYLMALNREIAALRERHVADTSAQGAAVAAATGFFLLRSEELSAEELSTLQTLARIRLQADGRPLTHHVQEWTAAHDEARDERDAAARKPLALATLPTGTVQPARGEFSASSGEFRFDVDASQRPQRPWINVLSNKDFGAQLSEAGGGFSWALNSRLNQLTAWSNDPVADPPSEWFLLQDRKTSQAWSITPSAWGALDGSPAAYRVAHGQGYSTVSHRRGELEVVATWCVDPQTSVKQVRIRLVNRGSRTAQLRMVGIAEWMMGANRSDRGTTQTSVHRQAMPSPQREPMVDAGEQRDQKLIALLCTQRERSAGFGEGTAFLAATAAADEADDWTCDRRECFDAAGALALPELFGQKIGGGLDPCAALALRVNVGAGETVERVFLLGFGVNAEVARKTAAAAAAVPALQRMEAVRSQWDRLLGGSTVKTPDPLFDVMVNRWLLYQAVACRLWGKAGFYQAGGATGFRDQLQDAMALAWTAPAMLREQIIVCASRQFPEGDVQHWWHAPTGAGVRTHFSDDLVWLPYACTHYVAATGDTGLLDESVAFLEGAEIPAGAEDAYYTPMVGQQRASVYEHAARTLDRSLKTGEHGLPLMGTGDWNDGMNRVGHEGRGESVWLAWFLCKVVTDFAPLARARGDEARAAKWEEARAGWQRALAGPGWDGQWFKRAFFDDGTPLGSHTNTEGRIDLIAQSWSVISDAAPQDLQRKALAAMETHLVDHQAGLLRLLDPPLTHQQPSAGYIQAYPPGVRENGGQYSHAGVWAMIAQAKAHSDPEFAGAPGSDDLAYRYFTYLSPAHRSRHPTHGPVYAIEPYVMAGDVYSQPPYVGRGGWSWYTGAAAWMHRAAIEAIFGLSQRAQDLSFAPCLPSHWSQAELTLERDGRTMRFVLVRAMPDAALETVAQADRSAGKKPPQEAPRLLLPGESLQWRSLPVSSVHVVPLLGIVRAGKPQAPASGEHLDMHDVDSAP